MHCKVIQAKVIGHLALKVHFADGLCGMVRVLPSGLRGDYAGLADPDMFAQMRVGDAGVCWPNAIHFEADTLYHAIGEYGEWVLA